MICCPNCDHDNIEGVDVCDRCGQPLSDLHLGDPKTDVERSLLLDRVSILWPRPPIVVAPDMRVHDVLRLLVDREIGCVFIVSADQKVTGVFSERDALLRLNTQSSDYKDRPISDFMTPNPQSLAADAKVAFAVHCMDLGGYRHIPIVDSDERVTGVISARDILRYLTEKMTSCPLS